MATALVHTEQASITDQAKSLQQSIKDSLEKFFAEIPELNMYAAQTNALVEQATRIKVFARDLTGKVSVFDSAAYQEAAEQLKAIAATLDGIQEIIHPYTEQAFRLHRTLTGLEKHYKAAADTETTRLRSEMSGYAVEEERRRREEEQRIAEEARKREQDRLVAEAALAHGDGRTEEAEAIMQEAMTVQAPATIIPKRTPQVAGIQQRSVWKYDAEHIDMETLKDEYKVPAQPNHTLIASLVKSMKKQAAQLLGGKMVNGKWVPAVKVYEDKTVVVK